MDLRPIVNKKRERKDEIEKLLADPATFSDTRKLKELNREYEDAKHCIDVAEKYDAVVAAIADAEKAVAEAATEPELAEMAKAELESLAAKEESLRAELESALVPAEPMDSKNCFVEIRAGAGGDEASLFGAELYRMYMRYCERRGWKCALSSSNRTELGGVKELVFSVEGTNAYRDMKYESGVHRVQRVPETEKQGRVHTSTVTVAVMPEAEEIDIKIEPKDIRIDTFLAGGHGGQSVQTTYSAVRITYLPTGMIVSCQDEKRQSQNRESAMRILRSRLLQIELDKRAAEEKALRGAQVGTGSRSEKIRTYNFPQDRITDHRIKKSWHNIPLVMDGDLDPLLTAVRSAVLNGKLGAAGGEDEDEE